MTSQKHHNLLPTFTSANSANYRPPTTHLTQSAILLFKSVYSLHNQLLFISKNLAILQHFLQSKMGGRGLEYYDSINLVCKNYCSKQYEFNHTKQHIGFTAQVSHKLLKFDLNCLKTGFWFKSSFCHHTSYYAASVSNSKNSNTIMGPTVPPRPCYAHPLLHPPGICLELEGSTGLSC